METKKISYQKLGDILAAAETIDTEVKDKLSYYVGKLAGKLKEKSKQYQEKITDINIKHCSVDEKGDIKKDSNGGLIFKKDALSDRNKDVRVLSEQEVEVDFSNCICPVKTRVLKLPIQIIDELNGVLFEVTESDFSE